MGEFTYGFGFKPKEYIADSFIDIDGKNTMFKMSRFAEGAGLFGNITAKLGIRNSNTIKTAQEILHDTYGKIDYFAAEADDEIKGIGAILKAFNKRITIVAVKSEDSPENPDMSVIDEIIDVTSEQANNAAEAAAEAEGLPVSISSGAVLFAAATIAMKPENKGKNIVVLLPDSGKKYLSAELSDVIDN